MIKREQLLALLSRDISDALSIANDVRTHQAADAVLSQIYLNVILPLLDTFEKAERPVYRDMLVNSVKSLVEKPEEPQQYKDGPTRGIQVRDDD
jgi:hypothetical protein